MFKNDSMVALRNLIKNKVLSAINILGLAVGMAGFILIVLYVQNELSYDQHHVNKYRIYRLAVSETTKSMTNDWATTSAAWAPALARDNPDIERFVRLRLPDRRVLVRYGRKSYFEKYFLNADSTVFDVFTIPLLRGNAESALSSPNSVVLSESMVSKYFADEDPIGKTILADDETEYNVTGVMQDIPETSHFHADFLASSDYVEPAVLYIGEQTDYSRYNFSFLRHQNESYTYLLLKDESVADELETQFPMFIDKHLGVLLETMENEYRPFLQPLTDIHLKSSLGSEFKANGDIKYIYIFSMIAGVILLITCINAMSLTTTHLACRTRTVGIRKLLGANWIHLIRNSTCESVFLSLIALAVALGLVHLLMPQFSQLSGRILKMDYESTWLLATLAGITLFVGIVVGGFTAYRDSFISPIAGLTGIQKARYPKSILRRILFTFQMTISVFMITGTAITFDQLAYIQNKNLGFNPEHIVVVRMPDSEAAERFPVYRKAILPYPEIVNVSLASQVPGMKFSQGIFRPEETERDYRWRHDWLQAGYDFIETMEFQLTSGRTFSRAIATDTTACLINETAASVLGWENPLNKTFSARAYPKDIVINVIGVVADFHMQSLHHPIEPLIIEFFDVCSYTVVRLNGEDLSRGLEILQEQWQEVFPNSPNIEYSFLNNDLNQTYLDDYRIGSVFTYCAVLSILIAGVGLWSLACNSVEQRNKEIGVRKMLGASRLNVILLMSKGFTMLILIAFLIGVPIIYYTMQLWLANFTYRTDSSFWPYLFAGFTVLLVSWLNVGYHALKSTTADPDEALRAE